MLDDIQALLASIAHNPALTNPINIASRIEALDRLEFVIDRLAELRGSPNQPAALATLQHHAEHLTQHLESINAGVFQQLRGAIRTGTCRGATLKAMLDQYAPTNRRADDYFSYDVLDVLINGVLLPHPAPSASHKREPEMVDYQPTPARIVSELVAQAQLTAADLFYDLGAGLGQVPMLVHLLSGVRTVGVEYQPSYCAYARTCAAELDLRDVSFVQADVRNATYTDGTVFFLYTPCVGSMLQTTLDLLRIVAHQCPIRIFSYGPCTPQIAQQLWLKRQPHGVLGIFST
jgi:SAM-dependent methyltransferase